MANRWGNNGNSDRFYFGGLQKSLQMVIAAMKLKDACSLEENLWQAWTAYSIAETSLCQQSLYSQSYGFSSSHVWMWVLDHKEGQALKNWYFWVEVLKKPLESSLDSKEIQFILKEISPEYSLEWLMLKLKLQYFGHLIYTGDSLEKTLMLGEIEGKRRREWQGMRWLGGTTNLKDTSLSNFSEMVARKAGHAAIHGGTKNRTDWTTKPRKAISLAS